MTSTSHSPRRTTSYSPHPKCGVLFFPVPSHPILSLLILSLDMSKVIQVQGKMKPVGTLSCFGGWDVSSPPRLWLCSGCLLPYNLPLQCGTAVVQLYDNTPHPSQNPPPPLYLVFYSISGSPEWLCSRVWKIVLGRQVLSLCAVYPLTLHVSRVALQ